MTRERIAGLLDIFSYAVMFFAVPWLLAGDLAVGLLILAVLAQKVRMHLTMVWIGGKLKEIREMLS